jgi:CBS domain-containing protein
MLKVKDVLKAKSYNICSIPPRTSVFKALQIMDKKDIEALVVSERGCVVGIFSEHDYAGKKILDRKSIQETSVGKLMSTPVLSISPETSVEECITLMTDTRSRHLPVFENNRIIGIVSVGDMEQSTVADSELCDSVGKAMTETENGERVQEDDIMHVETSDLNDKESPNKELQKNKNQVTDNIAPIIPARRQNKRRKSLSYAMLVVVFLVFSVIAFPLVPDNIKQGLITSMSITKPTFSQDNDKMLLNISTNDNYIKDLSKPELVEPIQAQQELADSGQINEVIGETNKLKEKEEIRDLNQSFTNEVSTGNNEYYIQVGTWKNSNLAEMLLLKIKKYYPEAHIVKQNNFNKIRIPGVLTKKQGTIVSEDLEDKFNVKPLLVLKIQ